MTQFNITRLEEKVGESSISLETGLMAKQADASVIIRMGDTMLLASAVSTKQQASEPSDFVPLTVNYKERTYAAGKFPGGFFKRETRPSIKEILSSRLSDRSIRPLFPEGFTSETSVTLMVLSADDMNDSDILGITAASAALTISAIPFNGPVAAVRIAISPEGQYIINPVFEQRATAVMQLVIAGTSEGILMVEGGGNEVHDDQVLKALEIAHVEIKKLCALQLKMREACGKEKVAFEKVEIPQEVITFCNDKARGKVSKLLHDFLTKEDRDAAIKALKKELIAELLPTNEKAEIYVPMQIENIVYEESRKMVLTENVRADGRKPDEIRPLNSIVGLLPRTHGSALFTRGQTQGLVVCTLGTPDDRQLVEGLQGEERERFLLHYNFPGFATGEVKPDRAPGRREIGHGELAKRALTPLLPTEEEFPYTIRLVSDIMESNGSSSMASVCGGSLSLFDAGVPVKAAVSGIAMGLITDGEKHVVLSDIMGMEDHLGDMDFKTTGTTKGITAFQMDVKLAGGIPIPTLKEAIEQANRGRLHILEHMNSVIAEPRKELSDFAPMMERITIPQDKIGALIGPGGKNIRAIQEETNSKLEVDDDGIVFISALDKESLKEAKRRVEACTAVAEVGKVYEGTVVNIQPFGAFLEILPGIEGLLHISEIAPHRINKVEDVLSLGQKVEVKVVEIDNNDRVKLSRKVLLGKGTK